MKPCVVIAAGGTGGHIFPGLALATALHEQADVLTIFVGTARGLEARLVREAGHEIELFDVSAMKGGGPTRALRGGFRAARALGHALAFVRRRAPVVVVSVGGYASGPVALAAAMLGVPVAVIEPNSVMGLSNRILSPMARRIYLAFGEARPALAGSKVRLSGVPLRAGFAPTARTPSKVRRVLVLGGSQGAGALNERLPEALGRVLRTHRPAAVEVVHQTGDGRDAVVREAYARAGFPDARVVPFTGELAKDLASADLVVARAGAGTIAEIAAVGRASLLVPFPHAADDHQARNASAYAGTGSAVWLRQDDADVARLAVEIAELLVDDARREQLAACARAQGRPEAARTIARDLLDLVEVR